MPAKLKNRFAEADITKYYYYRFDKTHVFCGHRHAEYEINIIHLGTLSVTVGTEIYELSENNAVIIPPNYFHLNRVLSEESLEMTVVHFNLSRREKLPPVFTLSDNARDLCRMFDNSMLQNADFSSQNHCIALPESSKKLFELLLLSSCTLFCPSITSSSSCHADIYGKAANFMSENIYEKLSLSDISNFCGVCKTTLNDVFKEFTGCGCMSFFRELKLEEAKKMLLFGKSCGFVSDSLGFSSQAHFTKCFKTLYGYTPNKIR